MNKYDFGGETFRTKADVKKRRHGLAQLGVTYSPGFPGFEFLADLYAGHPDAYGKLITQIGWMPHPNHGGRELGVVITLGDGAKLQCRAYEYGLMTFDEYMDDGARHAHWVKVGARKLVGRMRKMVHEPVPPGTACRVCTAPAVDMHHDGVDFMAILDAWRPPGALLVYDDTVDGAAPRFALTHVHESWVAHHAALAKLVPLCKACHDNYTFKRGDTTWTT